MRTPSPEHVLDRPSELSAGFTAESLSELHRSIRELARQIEGRSRLVDEYTPKTLVGDAETTLTLQPQFERLTEVIDHIIITGPSTGNSTTLQSENQATAPAINTVITTVAGALPGVTYLVSWKVDLDGTPGAGDANNFQLRLGGNTLATSSNNGAVGSYPQLSQIVTIPAGGSNLTIRSDGTAGTAGAIYTATMTLTPLSYTVSLQLGDRFWPNLTLPASGVLEISPKYMLLEPQHLRVLTATYPGQYSLELTGRAYVGNRE